MQWNHKNGSFYSLSLLWRGWYLENGQITLTSYRWKTKKLFFSIPSHSRLPFTGFAGCATRAASVSVPSALSTRTRCLWTHSFQLPLLLFFSFFFFFTPAVVIGARFMAIGRTPAAPFTVARFFADFLCFFSCPPFRKRTGSSRRRPRRAAPYPTHGQIVDDSARVAAGETRRQRSPWPRKLRAPILRERRSRCVGSRNYGASFRSPVSFTFLSVPFSTQSFLIYFKNLSWSWAR